MKGPSTIAPSDVENFQKAAGTILAQLYDDFPMAISIDRVAIARALARTEDVLNAKLPSGMPLDEFLSSIIVWLREEDFIRDQGAAPGDMVSLSGKSLLALNKTLRGSIVTVGQRLSEAARMGTWCWDDLGDLGGLFGGSIKSTNSAYKLRSAPCPGESKATS
jgi:hypothetical protein